MNDFVAQRKTMVESQVRPSDITDRRVIRAMAAVPRELFVPEAGRVLAYRDDAVAIAAGQPGRPPRYLMSARALAVLIQLMDLGDADRVLVVGSGGGYSTAVLSRYTKSVVALEVDPALSALAERALAAAAVPDTARVIHVTGSLAAGHAAAAPYDAILVEGAVTAVPEALLDQLKDGGRLVAILLESGIGRASVWRRSGETFAGIAVRDMNAAVLPGFEAKAGFVF